MKGSRIGGAQVIPAQWTATLATAAVILVDGCKYLLQRRDGRAGIWYPDHWGLFGGTVEEGETVEAAMRRELSEEIGLVSCEPRYFMDMSFGFSFAAGKLARTVFEVRIDDATAGALRLCEGSEMRAFLPQEIPAPVVPGDLFVLDLHIRQLFQPDSM